MSYVHVKRDDYESALNEAAELRKENLKLIIMLENLNKKVSQLYEKFTNKRDKEIIK